MIKGTKNLEEGYGVRDYMEKHLNYKTYPVPGHDVYEVKIYYKSGLIGSIKVDGMEMEHWRHRNNPDPDSYTYDELEAKGCIVGMPGYNKDGDPVVKMETPIEQRERQWKEGLKIDRRKPTIICARGTDMKKARAVVDEANRKEGWD